MFNILLSFVLTSVYMLFVSLDPNDNMSTFAPLAALTSEET